MKTYQTMLAAAGATLALVIATPVEAQTRWTVKGFSDEFTDEKFAHINASWGWPVTDKSFTISCEVEGDWSSVTLILRDGELAIDEKPNTKLRVDKGQVFSFPVSLTNRGSYFAKDPVILKQILKEMNNSSPFKANVKIGNNPSFGPILNHRDPPILTKNMTEKGKRENAERNRKKSFPHQLNILTNEHCPYLRNTE